MSARSSVFGLLRPPMTGRHVLIYLIAFFGVIFAVNGVFLYVSLKTHPGVTSDDAYRKGLRFNLELDRADRQSARGWKTDIGLVGGTPEIRISDKAGRPVTGLSVNASARRPVHDRSDKDIILQEVAAGRYRADSSPLSPGRWELVFTASRDDLAPYRIEHAVQVRK